MLKAVEVAPASLCGVVCLASFFSAASAGEKAAAPEAEKDVEALLRFAEVNANDAPRLGNVEGSLEDVDGAGMADHGWSLPVSRLWTEFRSRGRGAGRHGEPARF